MLVIGLTGSIGMGKSTVAQRFGVAGVPVIDADAIVHELYRGAAVAPIEAAFPGTTANGVVDRVKLSGALLADPSRFAMVEGIIHPLVRMVERHRLKRAAADGATMAVLEVPLLFETGGDAKVDVTIVVSAPPDVQRVRVLARPGMTDAKLDQILTRQLPDAEKRRRADYVVDTGRDLTVTLAEVDAIIVTMRGRRGTAFAAHWA